MGIYDDRSSQRDGYAANKCLQSHVYDGWNRNRKEDKVKVIFREKVPIKMGK